ncbi:Lysophospholipase L1 [Paenibacillus sp. ov031]|uniref:SGNH/GDSL hydrolase family protein n=1 Tax=Paenibacillus sp. ov031 TaxID=1761879 RepID=UPI00092263CE|nr:SGNH/GDSL hydrolase family protein [Paenibacillus sp. ov031]SHN55766.1 Lysophospholipase L1 [Paenibacillus sp. ov031]
MSSQSSSYEGQKAVFLGDSITFGYGLQEGEHPYPELVCSALGFQSYENHGISGSSVADGGFEPMCNRIGQMHAEADVIFFMGGRNDFSSGMTAFGDISTSLNSKDTFYGALKHIAEELIQRYPTKLIVFLTPPHGSSEAVPEDLPNTVTRRIYSDYVAAIREVASLYSIPVCDLWNIAGIQPLLPVHKDLYFTGDNGVPDGLHPNQAGHERIASRIVGFLKSL